MARDLVEIVAEAMCNNLNDYDDTARAAIAAVAQHLTAQAGASVVTVVSVDDINRGYHDGHTADEMPLRAWIEGAMK